MNPIRFLLFILLSPFLIAQTNVKTVPDCTLGTVTLTASTTSSNFDNRTISSNVGIPCTQWILDYYTTNAGTITGAGIQMQVSGDTAGTPTAFTSAASSTATPSGRIQFTGSVGTPTAGANTNGYYPWLRIAMATGTATVKATLIGWRDDAASNSNGSGTTTTCTAGSPCIVIGPDAVAAAFTQSPVQVSGSDGTLVRRILTDTSGRTIEVGAAATGAAAAGNPVLQGTNGTGGLILPMQSCPLSAVFTSTTAGETVIIAASGSNKVRVCEMDMTPDNAGDSVNFEIDYGTGAACVTAPTQLSALYSNVISFSNAWAGPQGPLITPASQAVCFKQTSSVSLHGMVIYAYTSY